MGRPSRRSKALQFLHDRYIGDDPEKLASLERGRLNLDIAQQIYDLRTEAKLTQRKLAAVVGTTASVICQLEDADYRGHSLSMLHRIATALSARVEVKFVPLKRKRPAPARARKRQIA